MRSAHTHTCSPLCCGQQHRGKQQPGGRQRLHMPPSGAMQRQLELRTRLRDRRDCGAATRWKAPRHCTHVCQGTATRVFRNRAALPVSPTQQREEQLLQLQPQQAQLPQHAGVEPGTLGSRLTSSTPIGRQLLSPQQRWLAVLGTAGALSMACAHPAHAEPLAQLAQQLGALRIPGKRAASAARANGLWDAVAHGIGKSDPND